MIPCCQRGLLPNSFKAEENGKKRASVLSLFELYSNKLKLNAEKTEDLPFASAFCVSSVGRDNGDIGGKRIPFKSSLRNLGVHHDQTLSVQQHISNVCHTAYLELRRIASVRLYLTQSATAQLIS